MASDDDVKTVLRRYAERAIAVLHQAGHKLPPRSRRDWGWQATGDGSFVFRSFEESGPLLPYDRSGLHSLPEFGGCLDVLRAHPVIGPRLDVLVGSALGALRMDADGIPDRVLISMLSHSDDLAFDEATFGRAADSLISWLTRSEESYSVIAPLSGLVATSTPIALEPGIEIDEMTDDEVANCLAAGLMTGSGAAVWATPELDLVLPFGSETASR